MRYARWIFIVVLLSILMSFMEKDSVYKGLKVGNVAPDFSFVSPLKNAESELSDLHGKYVLLSFWASYDAKSRMSNTMLCHMLKTSSCDNIEMVSVSFDSYSSIFEETVRRDQIDVPLCYVETKGESSNLFKRYRLEQGFTNYLLDEDGVIVAKNISASQLAALMTGK